MIEIDLQLKSVTIMSIALADVDNKLCLHSHSNLMVSIVATCFEYLLIHMFKTILTPFGVISALLATIISSYYLNLLHLHDITKQ